MDSQEIPWLSCSILNMSSHWLLCCIVCHEKSAVNLLAFPHTWWVMFLLLLLRFSHFLCLSAFYHIFRYGSVCFYSIWGSSCFWKYRSMLFFKFQAFSHYFFCTFPFLSFLAFFFWYFCYIYFGIAHFSQVLSIFILFIPITFHILLIYLQFLDPFFFQLKSTIEPFKWVFHFTHCTLQF